MKKCFTFSLSPSAEGRSSSGGSKSYYRLLPWGFAPHENERRQAGLPAGRQEASAAVFPRSANWRIAAGEYIAIRKNDTKKRSDRENGPRYSNNQNILHALRYVPRRE